MKRGESEVPVPSSQTDRQGETSASLRASVVIPTYNRSASLENVLLALGKQTVAASCYEVIVVADGCTDGTAALVRRVASHMEYRLRVVEQVNSGPAAARNRGIDEATSDLILFIDDDVVPAQDWIAVHLAAHGTAEDDIVVACGPLLPPVDFRLNAWGDWEEHVLCEQYREMAAGLWSATSRQFYTGNASIAKHHILRVGGFDAAFPRAEDIELGQRLHQGGCSFIFLPNARAWHYVQRSFASWSRMPISYGRAAVAMSTPSEPVALEDAVSGYVTRNVMIRACTRACLRSPRRLKLLTSLLHQVAKLSWWCHLTFVSRSACSMMYNVRYYHSLANSLPDVDIFWRLQLAVRQQRKSRQCENLVRPLVIEVLSHRMSDTYRGLAEVGVAN